MRADDLQWQVSLVGCGEVVLILAEDLRGQGVADRHPGQRSSDPRQAIRV